MKLLLLYDTVGAIIVLLGALLFFYLYSVVLSFVSGRKVKSGLFGPTMAKPTDLPEMVGKLSNASVSAYHKIKMKLSNKDRIMKGDDLTATLTKIVELKEQGTITEEEYQNLRTEILKRIVGRNM
jgi:hypothetical protein